MFKWLTDHSNSNFDMMVIVLATVVCTKGYFMYAFVVALIGAVISGYLDRRAALKRRRYG